MDDRRELIWVGSSKDDRRVFPTEVRRVIGTALLAPRGGNHHWGGGNCPAFVLRAKIDLVLAHPDGSLEHLDFKTGAAKPDPIQEVAARVVVGAGYGHRQTPIRSTVLYVAEQAAPSAVLERATWRETWVAIKDTVGAILAGTDPHPNPSPLCQFCPYFGNGCSAGPAADAALAAWLDGDDA